MKQKKLDKILEEFRRNGASNLEFNPLGKPRWIASRVSEETDLIYNVTKHKYKYRIKPEYLKQLIIDEFNKNGIKNIEYKNTNVDYPAWHPSEAITTGQLINLMDTGYKYRIRKETTKPSKGALPVPRISENILMDTSGKYPGKYLLSISLYFDTKEETEAYKTHLLTTLPKVSN